MKSSELLEFGHVSLSPFSNSHIDVVNYLAASLLSHSQKFQHTRQNYAILFLLDMKVGSCFFLCCGIAVVCVYCRLSFKLHCSSAVTNIGLPTAVRSIAEGDYYSLLQFIFFLSASFSLSLTLSLSFYFFSLSLLYTLPRYYVHYWLDGCVCVSWPSVMIPHTFIVLFFLESGFFELSCGTFISGILNYLRVNIQRFFLYMTIFFIYSLLFFCFTHLFIQNKP